MRVPFVLPRLPRRAPRSSAQRDRRAFRSVLAVGVVAALVIPVGRPVGYTLADSLCTGSGCDPAFEDVPVCATVGRDRATASETRIYSTPISAAQGARLDTYGDGEVEIVVPSRGAVEVYRFQNLRQARAWAFDRAEELDRTIDAAAGPLSAGTHAGYSRVLEGMGLYSPHQGVPSQTGTGYVITTDRRQSGVLLDEATTGMSVQTLVPEFPLEGTPALSTLAARLGLTEFLVLTVRRDPAGAPLSLEVAGLGSESWSLSALRAPETSDIDYSRELSDEGGALLWRSYLLDLRRQANSEVFGEVFDTSTGPGGTVSALRTGLFDIRVGSGELTRNPYTALGDRVRDDAVFVEQELRLDGPGTSADSPASVLAPVYRGASLHPAPVSTSTEIRSADLSFAGSTVQPLLECSVPDSDTAAHPAGLEV
ncbi:hypothetical protein ACUXNS_000479 [Brevibacterium pityocampae]